MSQSAERRRGTRTTKQSIGKVALRTAIINHVLRMSLYFVFWCCFVNMRESIV